MVYCSVKKTQGQLYLYLYIVLKLTSTYGKLLSYFYKFQELIRCLNYLKQ